MKRYSLELRQQALDLKARGDLREQDIANQLGVSKATVNRWLHPAFEEDQRYKARQRKYRHGGTCVDCGVPTSAVRIGHAAPRCRDCFLIHTSETRRWTREAVIAAIKRWNKKYGHPPSADEWERAGDDHPAISTIRDGPNPPFRLWSEAITAAGFTPNKHRRFHPRTRQAKIQAAKRREQRIAALNQALAKGEDLGNRH